MIKIHCELDKGLDDFIHKPAIEGPPATTASPCGTEKPGSMSWLTKVVWELIGVDLTDARLSILILIEDFCCLSSIQVTALTVKRLDDLYLPSRVTANLLMALRSIHRSISRIGNSARKSRVKRKAHSFHLRTLQTRRRGDLMGLPSKAKVLIVKRERTVLFPKRPS